MLEPNPAVQRQPIFNLPRAVLLLLVAMIGIHFIRVYLLSSEQDLEVILTFAFIPVRITAPGMVANVLPGGAAASIWTFVTYAFLHADWSHVGFNALWLAAFGSPLAWRLGSTRFLLFSAAGAIAGGLLHLIVYPNELTPMVGASAAISAHMAGACRFVFAAGGPLAGLGGAPAAAYRRPAAPLAVVIRDRRVVTFLAVWFGLNLLFGLLGADSGLTSGAIAWDAHIGGFLAGLLLFPLFDPIRPIQNGFSPPSDPS
jgi:membrane associated rhomboid family serine protease